MKKVLFAASILIGSTVITYSQTNRINHFSHSGKSSTLNIFASKDNMGCGEALRGEYVPDTTKNPIIKIEEIDTSKIKNSVEIPKSKNPRKGMSLETNYDASKALKKFK